MKHYNSIMDLHLLRAGAKATSSAVVAARAVHAVRRLLTVDAAAVKVVVVTVATAPVVVIKAAVVTRVISPLIIVAFFSVRTFKKHTRIDQHSSAVGTFKLIFCKADWKISICLPGRAHLMIVVVSRPQSIIIRPVGLVIVTSMPWIILSIIVP